MSTFGTGQRSRGALVRKCAYAFERPSRSCTFGFQPIADTRDTSSSFRGVPSGFEAS